MRTFQRYASDIPVDIVGEHTASQTSRSLCSVGYGGLAISSDVEFKPGELVNVRITQVNPKFEGVGMVVWCDAKESGFDVGIQFQEGREAFAARMVAQVCQIEAYRQKVFETEGRVLSSGEAGLEWIERHAHEQEVQERAFIRHPSNIPIEISSQQRVEYVSARLRDFSLKGACYYSATPVDIGESIHIQLPKIDDQPAFKAEGVVVWCCHNGNCYEVGVKFRENDEVFFAGMFKQISEIESFKQDMYRKQGRKLTGEEAVKEFTAYLVQLKEVD